MLGRVNELQSDELVSYMIGELNEKEEMARAHGRAAGKDGKGGAIVIYQLLDFLNMKSGSLVVFFVVDNLAGRRESQQNRGAVVHG